MPQSTGHDIVEAMNERRKTDAVKTSITSETPDAGYDAWFRTKVQNSMDETDKGAKIFPAQEVLAVLGLDD